ncbi:DEAD/DEAH box helicase [Rhodococcus sp. BP-349]|uniref:DEAD/DEAH box helicase n=1 Tax=unclassified Rhodococcus (in: high G+C Gram-positive bacteria) TaxID=192944 RepID=UPI001C9B7E86|nr:MULTISPECIES: DEAD/DEAH box helicase [unclassified Rhodococcus (in: high G+C Gram-positive bacteria)]MBY6540048.1 DEAD/DEAH box helicase [Rhodococcus sp. BP-363]MBY6543624.1 DEAD/DEAH box helicase [Rhodococcus sp. BP-369]MBY6562854.1 DEAD/DEAH box helicase [Rhodococcus sp. BP-370]MBY6577146.1 DEAD/DEAH box helicase [Rhodococcus sp. BP-364]MBY6586447.1 DEAD/DEAH box helicase [Rhodococcus sp. BP-358]
MTQLREWQVEAFDAWRAAGHRGIVEAVTGTGKTRVGIAAMVAARSMQQQILVVVPTIDLLEQWFTETKQLLPSVSVGRRGNGHKDDFRHSSILISTIHSAIVRGAPQPRPGALLIADEVHRYGTDGFARVFSDRFDHRLGLTATLERQDEGVDTYILPYFESRIAGCDFARGRRDNVLAPVRVMTVAIDFTTQERQEFDEHDAIAREARKNLISKYGCAAAPFGAFMKDVTVLAEQRELPEGRLASRYMSAFSKRRSLLADCRGKLDALAALAPALAQSDRSIVFSETKLSAEAGAAALRDKGVKSSAYSSGLDRLARTRVLQQFRAGALTNLVAPRVLDEGIDVPSVDVGVIIASSSSRRQMIQRMGRVLRPKPGDRAAAFVILYVPGTMEDPALGAHEAFLDQLLDVAEEQVDVPLSDAAGTLIGWLAQPITTPREQRRPSDYSPASVEPAEEEQTPLRLASSQQHVLSASPFDDVQGGVDAMLRYAATLPPIQARVVVDLFGLGGTPPSLIEDIATSAGVDPPDVIAIRQAAIRGLEGLAPT